MLRLWRKKLSVVLGPDKVTIVMLVKGKLHAQEIVSIKSEQLQDWRLAVGEFERWVSENDIDNADVSFVISSSFVRYAMMPFDEGVTNKEERHTIAGLLLEGIYGEAAKQWRLALDEVSFGQPCLIAAIDSGLIEALERIVSECNSKIAAIQPYAAIVANAFNSKLQGNDGLLVIKEDQQVVLFEIFEQQIAKVRKMMLGSVAELSAMLIREILISGADVSKTKVFFYTTEYFESKLFVQEHLEIIDLLFDDQEKCFGVGFEIAALALAK